jgi:hypothetical protein
MDWGNKRKRLIEIVSSGVAILLIGVLMFVFFYKGPTCVDGKQNGTETGIDCGGNCPYLCSNTETSLSVSFVRAVSPQPNRTDIISYISNPNANASVQQAAYTVSLYNRAGKQVSQKDGTLNLPPGSTVPLYIPNSYEGSQYVSSAFLTFASSSIKWLRNSSQPILPTPSNIVIEDGQYPKITATLTNPTAYAIQNETVIATVFDAKKNAIAASQTVVNLPPQGSAPLVFTWNEPFPGNAVRVEILPALGM